MSRYKTNTELSEKRTDYMRTVTQRRKRNFTIIIIILLTILIGGSIYLSLFYNNNQTNKVSSIKDRTYNESKSVIPSIELSSENQNRLVGENKTDDFTDEMDVTGLLNGDFSSVIGVWENGEGNILEIYADGTTKDGQRIKITPNQKDGEIITGGIGVGGLPGGAGISFLNTGVSFPNITDHSDTSKPRIMIAQSVFDLPAEAYYYKVQNTQNESDSIVSNQEQALHMIKEKQPDIANNTDIIITFYKMIDNDYLFQAVSRSMQQAGGSGTISFYRVNSQGNVTQTTALGNPEGSVVKF